MRTVTENYLEKKRVEKFQSAIKAQREIHDFVSFDESCFSRVDIVIAIY